MKLRALLVWGSLIVLAINAVAIGCLIRQPQAGFIVGIGLLVVSLGASLD